MTKISRTFTVDIDVYLAAKKKVPNMSAVVEAALARAVRMVPGERRSLVDRAADALDEDAEQHGSPTWGRARATIMRTLGASQKQSTEVLRALEDLGEFRRNRHLFQRENKKKSL